jgi:ArsR family metal-binding transcriptional regulator
MKISIGALITHAKISQVVFALLVTSCQQVWKKLLTICNNLVDIIRLVTRLFQQVRYSHDKAVLLQPCVVNLVTILFIMTVSDLLEQSCDKSDNAIKLVTSC